MGSDIDLDATTALGVFTCEAPAGSRPGGLTVCAAHPVDFFGPPTAELLAVTAQVKVVCVNPQGRSGPAMPLATMVDRIEAVRRQLGLGAWVFWGMSGGGWLAQLYARRYPTALVGVVIESACLCFRERMADPACVLSPKFPAWRDRLAAAGLLGEDAPAESVPAADTEWLEVAGLGQVFRRRGGPALLVSPVPLGPAMQSAMPQLYGFDSRSWIRTLRVPTLVLCGTADPIVPLRHSRAIHEAIAGSQLVAIEGAVHVPTAEKREESARAFAAFAATLDLNHPACHPTSS